MTDLKVKVLQIGELMLRQKARPLSPDEIRSSDIQRLIEVMRDTMRAAPGVGLAAPQVGVPVQVAVIEDRAEYQQEIPRAVLEERKRVPVPFHVIINPVIAPGEMPRVEFFEGCLSMPGFAALVPRALEVHVEALNERAEPLIIDAIGWYARILQHEIEHLEGALYVDRMHSRSLTTIENQKRYWDGKPIRHVREELRLPPELL
jgi:peptide deformylase